MVGDPVSFTGDTRYEVITVLANCGSDIDRAKEALVVWISRKQSKGRSTEHILNKLDDIEAKFVKDTSLHCAFREARAVTLLPRSPCIPLPDFIVKRNSRSEPWPPAPIDVTSTVDSPGAGSSTSSPGGSPPIPILSTSSSTSSPVHSPLRSARNIDSISAGPSTAQNQIPWWTREPPFSPIAGSPPSPKAQVLNSPTPAASVSLSSSPEDTPRASRQSPPSRRYTPPDRRFVPHFPLPPVPASDPSSDAHSRPPLRISYTKPSSPSSITSPIYPITPTSPGLYRRPSSSTPSPISRDSEGSDFTDRISNRSFARNWQIVNPDPYPLNDVVRGDSPLIPGVHTPNSAKESKSGTEPPPPYFDQKRTYAHPDHWVIGAQLDRALKVCGVNPVVRREVLRCLRSDTDYEPPYWQTRLLECGLNPEAVAYLLQEMTRQVDWATVGREG
ncbi:hypothetical protein BDN67DRAFT_1010683 [Paxillus ammoniavirescens]|nr:hypothetical protein BDN67DRAFT_1010683 [Paxillus ammoniavirescens]